MKNNCNKKQVTLLTYLVFSCIFNLAKTPAPIFG